jgi:hypothetical protein
MLSLRLVMIQSDPGNHEEHDEKAERECQHVVGNVRACRDVQEEDPVNSHLGDGKNDEPQRDAGSPQRRGIGNPRSTELNEERKKIAAELIADPPSTEVVALHPAVLARYEQQLFERQDALSKGICAAFSEAAEALRELIDTVAAYRDPSRPGGVTVEISGRLNALGMDVDVLYRDLLLPFAAVPVQRLDQRGKKAPSRGRVTAKSRDQPQAKAFGRISRMLSLQTAEGLLPTVIGLKSVSVAKWPQPCSARASGRSYFPLEPLATARRASGICRSASPGIGMASPFGSSLRNAG